MPGRQGRAMTRFETIIQLTKIALAVVGGGYGLHLLHVIAYGS